MRNKISRAVVIAAVAPVFSSVFASASQVSDIYAGGPGSYSNLTGTVTGVYDTTGGYETFSVADATGSIVFYGFGYPFNVGDNLTFSGVNATDYLNSPEITSLTGTITFNSTGNIVTPQTVTLAQVSAAGNGVTGVPPLAESIVTIDDVTIATGTTSLANGSSYTISDNTGSVPLYIRDSWSNVDLGVSAANNLESSSGDNLYNSPVDITAYVSPYYGTAELIPLSIEPANVPEPSGLLSIGVCAAGLLVPGLLGRRRSGCRKA